MIEYKAEGRIRKLQWVYDGTARDVKSETSVEARHFQSTQGAIQHAIKKLIDDLKAKGILNWTQMKRVFTPFLTVSFATDL